MHHTSVMTAVNKKTKIEWGVAILDSVVGPRNGGGRKSCVHQSTPLPRSTSSCVAEMGPPTPLLSLCPQQPSGGILYSNHTGLLTLPQTQKASSYPYAFAPDVPAAWKPTTLPLHSLLVQILLLHWHSACRSVGARWHSALVVRSLSTHLPNFSAPKRQEFLEIKTQDDVTDHSRPPADGPMP